MEVRFSSWVKKKHFDQRVKVFMETVDELFEGEKAIMARQRAESIATVMQLKINQFQASQKR